MNAARAMARYEWIRFTSPRSVRAAAAALVFWFVLSGVGAGSSRRMMSTPLDRAELIQSLLGQPLLTGFTPVIAITAAIFGAGALSQELRYGSLRMLLVAQPSRARVLLVKAGTTAAIGVVAAVVLTALTFAISLVLDADGTVRASPTAGGFAELMAGYLVVVVCSAVLAVGLTAILGNRVRALGAAALWVVAVEPLLGFAAGRAGLDVAWVDLLRPGGASRRLIGSAASLSGAGDPQWWPALPFLLVITAAVLATGLHRFRRQGV